MNIALNNLAFVLGRESDLALFELESVFHRLGIKTDIYKISGNIALAKIDDFSVDQAKQLMSQLAGTIKVYSLTPDSKLKTQNDRGRYVADLFEILELHKGFRDFGISSYAKSLGTKETNALGLELKNKLKDRGITSRFVAVTEGSALSTIQTLKNKLDKDGIEIGIFEEGIGLLIALNNPEEWAMFDYEKPAADKFSGMLPPRLARTMINLALGQIQDQESRRGNQENIVLVDPFCGSGNILIEGLRLGLPVVGSDISEKAVKDSLLNCRWYNSKFKKGNYFVFQADALSEKFIESSKSKIENYRNVVLVSEPYLGKPKKLKDSFGSIVKEYEPIKKLYLDFLVNISKIVIPSGVEGPSNDKKISSTVRQNSRGRNGFTLCLVFPRIETKDKGLYSLFSACVDEIEKLGYTQIRSPFIRLGSDTQSRLIYGRDYQVVKREIVLLKHK